MQIYIVRLIANQELVGIIAAENIAMLADTIDEVTSPCHCEYAVLGNGGLLWPSKGAVSVPLTPLDDDADDDFPRMFDGVDTSELWFARLRGFTPLLWRLIADADVKPSIWNAG